MNNQDMITELLQNYRSYRFAVMQYEKHNPRPSAGVANYDGMPGGSGAPERFFASVGRMADMGHTSLADLINYQKDTDVVEAVEGALMTLTEDERAVIILKWMDGITLKQISLRKPMCINTIKKHHRRGLTKLCRALRHVEIPQINNLDKVCSF